MGQRRMFSLAVVDTDRFTEMPTSAQALYFHLGMHGDDDGFVSSPKKIQRSAGCNDDDMRLLAAKGFIIPFDSGVVVITDWRINNTLKNDRYVETIYQDEKAKLHLGSNKKYMLGTAMVPERNQNGTMLVPQHNITELNQTEPIQTEGKPADKPPGDFEKFWSAYPKKIGKRPAKKAFGKVTVPIETLLSAIERQKCSAQWSKDNGQYIPNPATWLNQGRWEDELDQPTSSPKSGPDGPELVPDGKGGMVWQVKN